MAQTLEIPQEILDSARLTVDEAKLELALTLYAQGRLSAGKARELAGVDRREEVAGASWIKRQAVKNEALVITL